MSEIGNQNSLNGQVRNSDSEAREHELNVYAKRVMEIPSNHQIRCDYDARTDGQPVYIGFAPRGLATDVTGWLLQEFTYDVSGQCTLRQTAVDTWDNRASATYA